MTVVECESDDKARGESLLRLFYKPTRAMAIEYSSKKDTKESAWRDRVET